MRVRVNVRRNGLPDTRVVWAVENDSQTIAQLLEQISEVIPLESGEWGLEDYAVELPGGFECLHFMLVNKVLGENDEVIIRPLMSNDLRARRVTGRDQISADGKHLVDGVAYGRPKLKRSADRPSIAIPPRKRQRLMPEETSSDEESSNAGLIEGNESPAEDEEDGSRQLMLRAAFEKDDEDSSDESDDDDFDPSELSEGDTEEEDDEGSDNESGEDAVDESNVSVTRYSPSSLEQKAEKLQKEFPDCPIEICKHVLTANNENLKETKKALSIGFGFKSSKNQSKSSSSSKTARKDKQSDAGPVAGTQKPATGGDADADLDDDDEDEDEDDGPEELQNPMLRHYDQHGLPPGSIMSGMALLHMANMAKALFPGGSMLNASKSASSASPQKKSGSGSKKKATEASKASDGNGNEVEEDESEDTSSEEESGSGSGSDESDESDDDGGNENNQRDQSDSDDDSSSDDETPANDKNTTNDSDDDSSSDDETSVNDNEASKASEVSHQNADGVEEDESEGTSSQGDSDDDSSSDNETSVNDNEAAKASEVSHQNSVEVEEDESEGTSSEDPRSESDSDSDSESDSDSSSGKSISSPEAIPSQNAKTKKPTISAKQVEPAVSAKQVQPVALVAPGKGRRSTQTRNQRRRETNAMNKYKEKGILPAGTMLSDFRKLKPEDLATRQTAEAALAAHKSLPASSANSPSPDTTTKTANADAELEARRASLLASVASGGVDHTSPQVSARNTASPHTATKTAKANAEFERKRAILLASIAAGGVNLSSRQDGLGPNWSNEQPDLETPDAPVLAAEETREAVSAPPSPVRAVEQGAGPAEPASDKASAKRSRLDLGAGRRLLFGALGLKTPKTKADEEKLKADMMKNVKPLENARLNEETAKDAEVIMEETDEDPEAWRAKINLSGVECCYEGVELSEPPFPFVQRWDPQQQGGWKKGGRGGKGKKNQRDQAQFYEDEPHSNKRRKPSQTGDEEDSFYDAQAKISDTSFQLKGMFSQSQNGGPSHDSNTPGNADTEVSQGNEMQMDSQAQSSYNDDDLAKLPEDPLSLPDLKPGDAKIGMTIAFQELICSQETKWEPKASDWRTAIVLAVEETGDIQVRLAKRDREIANEEYDEETGERIYAKFDMPVFEDEKSEEDDGRREYGFGELIRPKIVQPPPNFIEVVEAVNFEPSNDSPDDSTTLPNEGSTGSESKPAGQAPPAPPAEKEKTPEKSPPREQPNENNEPELPPVQNKEAPATVPEVRMSTISSDARQEILDQIKEAGFRSNVPSSVMKAVQEQIIDSPGDKASLERLQFSMNRYEARGSSFSPKFNGLGSSSPARPQQQLGSPEGMELGSSSPTRPQQQDSPKFNGLGSSSPARPQQQDSPKGIELGCSSPARPQQPDSPKFNGFGSSSPARPQQHDDLSQSSSSRLNLGIGTQIPNSSMPEADKSDVPSPKYPRLPITSGSVSLPDRQPDISLLHDDLPPSYQGDSVSQPERQPDNSMLHNSPRSLRIDSDSFLADEQDETTIVGAASEEPQLPSPKVSSARKPTPKSDRQLPSSKRRPARRETIFPSSTDDDDDLPPLEEVFEFSQRAKSQSREMSIKPEPTQRGTGSARRPTVPESEDLEYEKAMEELDAQALDGAAGSRESAPKASQLNKKPIFKFSQKLASQKASSQKESSSWPSLQKPSSQKPSQALQPRTNNSQKSSQLKVEPGQEAAAFAKPTPWKASGVVIDLTQDSQSSQASQESEFRFEMDDFGRGDAEYIEDDEDEYSGPTGSGWQPKATRSSRRKTAGDGDSQSQSQSQGWGSQRSLRNRRITS